MMPSNRHDGPFDPPHLRCQTPREQIPVDHTSFCIIIGPESDLPVSFLFAAVHSRCLLWAGIWSASFQVHTHHSPF